MGYILEFLPRLARRLAHRPPVRRAPVRVLGFSLCLLSACHETGSQSTQGEPQDRAEQVPSAENSTVTVAVPSRVALDVIADRADRWLWVERIHGSAPGAWATGSFDPGRNKLSIRTKDVDRFAVDVGRVPINWDRLVIIGINGSNSELRRRDYTVLHFALDDHGQWAVVEP